MSEQEVDVGLWDSRRVAAYLNVSEATLSRWRARRLGPPHVGVGRVARYRKESLDAWLTQQETQHGSTGAA